MFGEPNLQVQHVSKMALQNKLVWGMLLLKEHGVCGMLNLTGDCCVTTHHATTTIEEAQKKMRETGTRLENYFKQWSQQIGLRDLVLDHELHHC